MTLPTALVVGLALIALAVGIGLGLRALRTRRRRAAERSVAAAAATAAIQSISADELAYRIGVEGAAAPAPPRRLVVAGEEAVELSVEDDDADGVRVAAAASVVVAASVAAAAAIEPGPTAPAPVAQVASAPLAVPTRYPYRNASRTDRIRGGMLVAGTAAALLLTAVVFGPTLLGATNGPTAPDASLPAIAAATRTPSPTPSPSPSPVPTPTPTPSPTPMRTRTPTATPTMTPSPTPTATPTAKPTAKPTRKPTPKPTAKPTPKPTPKPTRKPTPKPTAKPTPKPPELVAFPSCSTSGYTVSCTGDASRSGVTYTWTFEAGPTKTGKNAILHLRRSQGTYTITLTVKDGVDSASDSLTEVVPQ